MFIPRGKLLALVAFVLAASLVTATGAFTSVEAERTTQVEVTGDQNAYLALEPSDGPNGEGGYAKVEDDGTLGLLLNGEYPAANGGEGVNPNAVTRMDNVFTVTNQGTQSVEVHITEGSATDAVTFYADGSPDNSLETGSGSVSLGPGEVATVGIQVDTTDGTSQGQLLESVTIHAESPNAE